jgi:adenosine deaminase
VIFGRKDGRDGDDGEGGAGGTAALSTGERIARAPKALLHDHLDGGLRPQTILEIADEVGYTGLPAGDAESLGGWFRESADSGSLVRYLETFDHTLAVMQTADGLRRVARECVVDLAADGVVYAESRYAPEQHLTQGLELEDVVEAVNAGFREGEAEAAEAGNPIRVTALLTAMRHAAKSTEIAELAVRYRDRGVAGFDIAGAEAGFPPTRHLDAFEYLRRENAHFTIHAGEAFGLPSIWEAIQWCGADRLGHGVRIVDDLLVRGRPFADDVAAAVAADPADVHLGRLAAYVRDMRIPLEMCPSSNVQTGAAESVALHPISLLKRLRFRVTVNTDNRLMSGTSMSREMGLLVQEADWSLEDLRWVTINAMKSAFIPFDERLAIIDDVVKPGYAERRRRPGPAGAAVRAGAPHARAGRRRACGARRAWP